MNRHLTSSIAWVSKMKEYVDFLGNLTTDNRFGTMLKDQLKEYLQPHGPLFFFVFAEPHNRPHV